MAWGFSLAHLACRRDAVAQGTVSLAGTAPTFGGALHRGWDHLMLCKSRRASGERYMSALYLWLPLSWARPSDDVSLEPVLDHPGGHLGS
jgi:hypothetical protein